MSKRIKNAPGTMKLGAGKVGTRAKAMREGARGPNMRLGMGKVGWSAPQSSSQECVSKKFQKDGKSVQFLHVPLSL